jgi:hypothetical protein
LQLTGSLTLATFVTQGRFTETLDGEMIGPDWSDELRTSFPRPDHPSI